MLEIGRCCCKPEHYAPEFSCPWTSIQRFSRPRRQVFHPLQMIKQIFLFACKWSHTASHQLLVVDGGHTHYLQWRSFCWIFFSENFPLFLHSPFIWFPSSPLHHTSWWLHLGIIGIRDWLWHRNAAPANTAQPKQCHIPPVSTETSHVSCNFPRTFKLSSPSQLPFSQHHHHYPPLLPDAPPLPTPPPHSSAVLSGADCVLQNNCTNFKTSPSCATSLRTMHFETVNSSGMWYRLANCWTHWRYTKTWETLGCSTESPRMSKTTMNFFAVIVALPMNWWSTTLARNLYSAPFRKEMLEQSIATFLIFLSPSSLDQPSSPKLTSSPVSNKEKWLRIQELTPLFISWIGTCWCTGASGVNEQNCVCSFWVTNDTRPRMIDAPKAP